MVASTLMTDAWNADQYEKFKAERSQPFHDLMGLVEARPGMRVFDLGCGTGELTRLLHERLRARQTVGVDSSSAMLERAGQHSSPGLRFVQGRIEDAPLEDADLNPFSNAALHWVSDHPTALRQFFNALNPGGQLAVQIPANFDHPSHRVADEVAAEDPFRDPTVGVSEAQTGPHSRGLRTGPLPSGVLAAIGEPPGVRPRPGERRSRDRMGPGDPAHAHQSEAGSLSEYSRFLERYRQALLPRLSDERPFLYTFKRILFWAAKPVP